MLLFPVRSSSVPPPAVPRGPAEVEDAEAPGRSDEVPGPDGDARGPGPRDPVQPPLDEGTLQLLPGWLEVVAGPGLPETIRFARVPGTRAEVTFGRQSGPEFRHVQLPSAAVSRLHARMAYGASGWTLRNESGTNPTRVNEVVLDAGSGDVPLDDGDRIEMGDVVLVFRSGKTDRVLSMRGGWHADRGPRPENQDAVLVRRLSDGREVAAVCDGMGSHEAGGRASQAAIEALVRALEEGSALEESVAAAQRAVVAVAARESRPAGVGTTLVAMLREMDSYRVANIGDSRAYRFHGGRLTQITRDHSFVREAVASGRMTEEEARRSPLRHAVTRSLGEVPAHDAEYFGPFPVREDEVLVLSSDGLHGVLPSESLERLLGAGVPVPDLPRHLVQAALDAGTRDNVAVAVLAFDAPSA